MFSIEERNRALAVYSDCGSVEETIRRLGYPTKRCLYNWIEQDKHRSEAQNPPGRKRKEHLPEAESWLTPRRSGSYASERNRLLLQLEKLQMSIDILKEIIAVRTGSDEDLLSGLSPEEATLVIDRLRDRYQLGELTEALGMKRSAYHYQKSTTP